MSLAERFWAKVDKRGPDECWPWTASGAHGYGRMRKGDRLFYAHRVAYELCIGPIPDGLTIDHLCRNTACVNPLHLEAVTMRENILRGEGPAARNARKTHCVRGHPLDGGNVYLDHRGGRECRVCRHAKFAAR